MDGNRLRETQRALQERDAILRIAASEAPMILQTRDRDLRLTFMAGGLLRELDIDPQRAITGVIGIAYDVTEQRQAHERTRFLADCDALTSLPNRAKLVDLLTEHVARSACAGRHAVVVAIDLEGFKRVNDTLGFDVGDGLLIEVARRLSDLCSPADTVSRSSGDEFVVVRSNLENSAAVAELPAQVLTAFDAPFRIGDRELFIRPSIGVSVYPQDGEEPEALLARADAALFQAAHNGRGKVQFFRKSLQLSALDRLTMETDLTRASERNEFVLCYQPIVDVRTRRLIGAEALLRWQHPVRGLIRPDDFITVAEETGLIVPIGKWVLRAACEQGAEWMRNDADFCITVNVSAAQVDAAKFEDTLLSTLSETKFDPGHLELEFTERFLMKDARRGIDIMRSLRSAGVRIGVDDFGTGYSSLAYLKQLPIDTMKIDQLFVRDVATVPYDAAIARAIIALGDSIHLRVIAEGVETIEQAGLLEALGCCAMQGYYFSKPVPREDFERFFIRSPFFPRGASRIES